MTANRLERLVAEAIETDRLFDPSIEEGLNPLERAQLAQYRRMISTLRELRSEIDPDDQARVAEVLAYIDESLAGQGGGRGRKIAYLGGLAVAGATGVVVYLVQHRRSQPALAG